VCVGMCVCGNVCVWECVCVGMCVCGNVCVWECVGMCRNPRSELEFLNRDRVGIGLLYRPARLHRLADLFPWNRFLGSLKV
jgi:hypothetical protein